MKSKLLSEARQLAKLARDTKDSGLWDEAMQIFRRVFE